MRSSTTHPAFDFKSYLLDRRELVEKRLDELLARSEPEILWESMRYSALGAGKRIRALLAISSYETIMRIEGRAQQIQNAKINEISQSNDLESDSTSPANSAADAKEVNAGSIETNAGSAAPDSRDRARGRSAAPDSRDRARGRSAGVWPASTPSLSDCSSGSELETTLAPVLPLSCAIEMVHAMSLIHDDLPCLDNDDFRRGKPTNHKAYGEAIALLSGDALLMKAMEVLIYSNDIQVPSGNSATLLDIIGGLATATGASGMVGGQVFDLIYTGAGSEAETIDETVIRKIHSRKTGALLRFSLWSGARLAQANNRQLKAMEQFGDIVGLAFQIADDLLDVTGDVETLGKTPGKDQAANKATWVSLFGVDGAQEKLQILENEGKQLLIAEGLSNTEGPILESLLEMAIHRHK